jgi:molybdate transport system substrate-binding protein
VNHPGVRRAGVRRAGVAALSATLLLTACGSSGGADRELLVFAAASLTESFRDIGEAFEREHPGVTVTFNFGPSDGLATQIREGAPADVFASASPRWMDDVAENGPGVSDRVDFAANRLVVIVPEDNPSGVEGIEDLAHDGVRLVLAAEGVPVGAYAREALANAGILEAALANVVSNEEDVKAVVQKVLLGEADAGIVYRTDVTAEVSARIEPIEIADGVNVIATYPIAVVEGSEQPDLAREFVNLVLEEGQDVLAGYGFLSTEHPAS